MRCVNHNLQHAERIVAMIRKFAKYVTQSVAGMIGISIYILADTFFISVCEGANGLAVLNLILPVYGLMYAIGAMIGIGSATRYSIRKAQGQNTDYFFTQSITWSVLCSLIFILVGIFLPGPFLALLGADAELITLGTSYLRIAMIGAPLFMCNYTFTAFARNDNAPAIAMTGSICGSLFNIVFDYILMFPLGMGMTGAALATAASPLITMLVCSMHFGGRKNHVAFRWKRLDLKHILSCCALGISAFVGEISSAVITIVFNMLILGIAGNVGVAAYGVIANLSSVAMSICNGLAQGVQPLISESHGRGDRMQVKKFLRWGILTSLVVEMVMVAAAWGWTDGWIVIFNSEQNTALLSYAHVGLRLYFLGFLFAGMNIMLVAYFSAVDRPRPAIVGSLMRGMIAIVVCAIVFASLFGLNGVWLSFLGSEVITFAVILVLGRKQ